MNSETPKDSTSSSHHHAVHARDVSDSETPGSHGLEMLEPLDADFDDGDGYDANNNDNDGNFLAPHERKLSLAEQRQLLAMRRRPDDDNDIEEADIRSGRRYWHLHNQEHGVGRDGTSGSASAAKDAPAESAATAAVVPPGTVVPGETAALLSDPANPNKPLYDAVLQGVGALDASKVPLTETEQVNVAAALTASMTQTPGFQRGNPDPMAISIAASESGDRVFAINSQNPGAPNAMYTSVEVEQARGQSLLVSSAQIAPPSSAPEPSNPAQEQMLSPEQQSPRSIA
jgi:hypothetical protein